MKGLVALAHTLDDAGAESSGQAEVVDWALQSRPARRLLGPASNDDWWPRMVVLFYLPRPLRGDRRPAGGPVPPRYFRHQLDGPAEAAATRLGAAPRAGDNMDVVLGLTAAPGERSCSISRRCCTTRPTRGRRSSPTTALRLRRRLPPEPHRERRPQGAEDAAGKLAVHAARADRDAFAAGVADLERQYGRIDGQFSGTERLSGMKSTDRRRAVRRRRADHLQRHRRRGPRRRRARRPDGEGGVQLAARAAPARGCGRSPTTNWSTRSPAPSAGTGSRRTTPTPTCRGRTRGSRAAATTGTPGSPKVRSTMWAATGDGGLAAVAYGPNRVTATSDRRRPGHGHRRRPTTRSAKRFVLRVEPSVAATSPRWCCACRRGAGRRRSP